MSETAHQPSAKRAARIAKVPALRSRVGNGKTLLAGADCNSAEYRELRDIVGDLVAHLGGDPTTAQSAIIEETAGLVYWCRRARLALISGGEFNIAEFCTATNALRRLLADLGLERRMKTILSVEEYAAATTSLEPEKRTGEPLRASEAMSR